MEIIFIVLGIIFLLCVGRVAYLLFNTKKPTPIQVNKHLIGHSHKVKPLPKLNVNVSMPKDFSATEIIKSIGIDIREETGPQIKSIEQKLKAKLANAKTQQIALLQAQFGNQQTYALQQGMNQLDRALTNWDMDKLTTEQLTKYLTDRKGR